MSNAHPKILLVGGGSGGPVSPLLAVATEIKSSRPEAEFLLVGTRSGPEKQMAEKAGVPFVAIPAGKLRRYVSWKNLLSPFLTAAGFLSAIFIVLRFRPDVVFGAGAFVQVPVMWAARLCGVSVVIHQQDKQLSLSTKLSRSVATLVTETFKGSVPGAVWTGNPTKNFDLRTAPEFVSEMFGLSSEKRTVLVMGGGTGAEAINRLVEKSLEELLKFCQVLHITGKGKGDIPLRSGYARAEFLPDMLPAYACAAAVVSRAGMGSLSELACLKIPAMVIPMPDTHQEANAEACADADAALVVDERKISTQEFVAGIQSLMRDAELRSRLTENLHKLLPSGGEKKVAEMILKLVEKKHD